MIETLRRDAAALLAEGKVKLVLGYRAVDGRRVPAIISDPAAVNELVYDDACKQNLATYLSKPEVRKRFPVAVVASPNVLRSLMVLSAEAQIAAGQVVVLAVDGANSYSGPTDLAAAGKLPAEQTRDEKILAKMAELMAMTPDERAAFWSAEFSKCTRCYACRANCPACYCKRCIVEKNQPQWVSTAAREHGNYAWQIIRAFHTAGRCVACGACEAACPQGIRLMLLNRYVAEQVEKEFGFKAGDAGDGKPFIGSFKPEDEEEFIR